MRFSVIGKSDDFASTSIYSRSSLLRATALSLALIGNLLPSVCGVSLAPACLLISVLIALVEFFRYLPVIHPVVWYSVALFGLLSISVLWTSSPSDYGREKLLKLLTSTMLTALIALIIRNKKDIEALALMWPVVALPIAGAAVLGFDGGRATGFDSNPIWVARALATGIILVVWRLWYSKELWKPSWFVDVAIAAVLTMGLLLSSSRGPSVGLLVGLLVLMTLSNVNKTTRVYILVNLSILALGALALSGALSTSRLVSLDSSGRTDLLLTSLDVVANHPGGVGFGNVSEYWDSKHNYPHNMFIEVFVEHGWIIGFVFFATVINTLIRVLRRSRYNKYFMLAGAILAMEVVNISFSGDLNARTFFLFFMLALWMLFQDRKGKEAYEAEQTGMVPFQIDSSITKRRGDA